jgi:hypothetical protein
MLSLRSIMPGLPMIAALSANHLAAILFPAALRRLYIARDSDPAGEPAFTSRSKIAGLRHPPLRFGRCRCARRCRSGPPAVW